MRPNSYEAYIYVDAQYVRQELKNSGQSDMFDPSALWDLTRTPSGDFQPVRAVRMFFYEAIDEHATEQEKMDLQSYLETVERLNYVSVATGFMRPGRRSRREQKGVDVQIAVDALEAASGKRTDAIMLVSGDADFCPLADAVRRTGVFMLVYGFEKTTSAELIRSADMFLKLPDPATKPWKCF